MFYFVTLIPRIRKRSTDALRSAIGSELPPRPGTVGRGRVAQMYSDWFYSFIVGFVGAILFLLVDNMSPKLLWRDC